MATQVWTHYHFLDVAQVLFVKRRVLRCRCCLEEHQLRVGHKQGWSREFILLTPQAVVLPVPDASSDGVGPGAVFTPR